MALAPDDADDDFRCAVWTAAQGYDPIGSAPRFDRLVTVEVPQPWPSAIEDLPWLQALEVPAATRLQAIVADAARPGGEVMVTRWERHRTALAGMDWLVPADAVPETLAVLATGGQPSDLPGAEAPPEVLVCGHGARDRCCGSSGTRLHVAARAALGDVRVRRTSHLGGHRYAPTALTLPEGRMWAFLDTDALAGIVRHTLPAAEAREFYRGNVALDPWAQVVEAAVLEERGWAAVDFDELTGTSTVADADRESGSAEVELRWTSAGLTDERRGTVAIVTHYPVLQCGFDPSQATKTAPEYRLVA